MSVALCGMNAQFVLTPVAVTGQAAPGMGAGVTFTSLDQQPALDALGRVVLFGAVAGPGITGTNRNGIWFGAPGSLGLVVRTGTAAPGTGAGVYFSSLYSSVALDRQGHLAFFGYLTGSGIASTNARGIWSALPGAVSLVAQEGSPAPGTAPAVTFATIDPPLLCSSNVAFDAVLTGPSVGPTNSSGVWVSGADGFALAVRGNDPAPGTDGRFIDGFGSPDVFALSAGGLTFRQSFVADGSSGTGVWAGAPGALQLIATNLMLVPVPLSAYGLELDPAINGFTFGLALTFYPDINDTGTVAFVSPIDPTFVMAPPSPTSGRSGIGVFVANGSTFQVAAVGLLDSVNPAPAPGGAPGETFAAFSSLRLGSGGAVAFLGWLQSFTTELTTNAHGIWAGMPGSVKLVARDGASAPGTSGYFQNISAASDLFVNADGFVAFGGNIIAGPGVTAANGYGIWTTAPDGALRLVVRQGDTLNVGGGVMKTIQQLAFAPTSSGRSGTRAWFNDAGQVLFWAMFTDGSSGVFTATPPPAVRTISLSGTNVVITFRTAAGMLYNVETSETLLPGSWIALGTNFFGDGSLLHYMIVLRNARVVDIRPYMPFGF